MDFAETFSSIFRVAGLALAFGAGVPLLFALGMRCMTGDAIRDAQGVVVDHREAAPGMKMLGWLVYALLVVLVVVAITWISKDTLNHYLGWNLFPGLSSKH
ncbi:hypothetical protein GC425_03350 [Corynebacterium sp. zg254]|uniref:DUF4190 domain-containing protein n=1 Tax=Corynebacterium zhongnanshanii TaxID=2768834 RepID=A0ABQ6VFE3_9CORY|nr:MULTISPECIES: hypothetical protein [Corynebacterium]KAB3523010.1 hypothetical protein F8377_02270 [Corynebacterium zhongnanshanii]MCR5913905.1 hypothetical protein [Corynebacterium sp. zg254]